MIKLIVIVFVVVIFLRMILNDNVIYLFRILCDVIGTRTVWPCGLFLFIK